LNASLAGSSSSFVCNGLMQVYIERDCQNEGPPLTNKM
jgi:hypothetical protein